MNQRKIESNPGLSARISRRRALKRIVGAVPAFYIGASLAKQTSVRAEIFNVSRQSLASYRIPDWFRDAKFGIWAHWGPQSAPEDGDWYARNMYLQGTHQYESHLKRFGHPSRFGYKDIIRIWKGDLLDADHLIGLYKKAGAKYFMSMGVHVDNFDLWNSRFTRWNAVNFGPRLDVVGAFRKAARRHGLRFGVSDHLWMAYKWLSVSRGSDVTGPLAGVPYDGVEPQNVDLYLDCPEVYRKLPWNEDGIPEKWKHEWFLRIRDLVDQHEPDIIYCDGQIPFGHWGLELVAHFYNQNRARHSGRLEAVYTSKGDEDFEDGICVFDKERGIVDGIWPTAYQTDTCVGHWHYDRNAEYKTPKRIIDMLVDTVSRNGNLLLNFPLNNRGTLDDRELKILSEITDWMSVNSKAIHGTRPWKIFGEGPTLQTRDPKQKYNETNRKDLTAADIRFTTKDRTLYAFFMGWPENGLVTIKLLGKSAGLAQARILRVGLLGSSSELKWNWTPESLTVKLPERKPCDHACALKIVGLEI
jgi:alpha-L-fucosidase